MPKCHNYANFDKKKFLIILSDTNVKGRALKQIILSGYSWSIVGIRGCWIGLVHVKELSQFPVFRSQVFV